MKVFFCQEFVPRGQLDVLGVVVRAEIQHCVDELNPFHS